jgi:hypothetical protein
VNVELPRGALVWLALDYRRRLRLDVEQGEQRARVAALLARTLRTLWDRHGIDLAATA